MEQAPLIVSTVAYPALPDCTFEMRFPDEIRNCSLRSWHPSTSLLVEILFPGRTMRFKKAKYWTHMTDNWLNESVVGQLTLGEADLTDVALVLNPSRQKQFPNIIGPLFNYRRAVYHHRDMGVHYGFRFQKLVSKRFLALIFGALFAFGLQAVFDRVKQEWPEYGRRLGIWPQFGLTVVYMGIFNSHCAYAFLAKLFYDTAVGFASVLSHSFATGDGFDAYSEAQLREFYHRFVPHEPEPTFLAVAEQRVFDSVDNVYVSDDFSMRMLRFCDLEVDVMEDVGALWLVSYSRMERPPVCDDACRTMFATQLYRDREQYR